MAPDDNAKRTGTLEEASERENLEEEVNAVHKEVPATDKAQSAQLAGTIAHREHPLVHPPVDAPLCANCRQIDLEFFDPSCPGCRQILVDPTTTVAQIMACMRQWVPQTQRNIDLLVEQVLQRGAHPNDRDGLTDLTLLHFACRAGASGVGDGAAASRAVVSLLSLGADVGLSCKWTQLSSLHYAAYFDASAIVHLLLETIPEMDVNITCAGYDTGTALHIAASNLCLETVRVLLRHGAKLTIKDSLGRVPKDCVLDAANFENIPHIQDVISTLKRLLTVSDGCGSLRALRRTMEPVSGRALLRSMGLTISGQVMVAGIKPGVLRFCGTTEFAVGLWMGVELDSPEGKHDGSVHGVTYFKCRPNHGIFVPINKISKTGTPSITRKASIRLSTSPKITRHSKLDLSKVTSKIKTGLQLPKSSSRSPENETPSELFKIGHRVLVSGKRKATVRYYGQTKFAQGYWYGLELDQGVGKNDGSVQGVRYFTCAPNFGIFACPSRVTHLLTSSEECLSGCYYSGDGSSSSEARTLSNSPDPDINCKATTIRRNLLRMSFQVKSPSKRISNVHVVGDTSPALVTVMRCFRHEYAGNVFCNSAGRHRQPAQCGYSRNPRIASLRCQNSPQSLAAGIIASPQNGRKNEFCLSEGVTVLVNNELGIVRYMGHVAFSEGVWIGVELRQPHGKNHGTVQGKQYFSCKPNHGLLVRPHKVTVHGINGSKLIPESLVDSTPNGNENTRL